LQAFIAVVSLFFVWGFITVFVDSLVPRLREVFEIGYGTSGLFQTAFFLAYGIIAIPAGILISKTGYKKGIIIGLGTMAAGCLLYSPAASFRFFGLFLLAFFVVAGGMTILQVAANPYISVLGKEKTASARLNLAQAFNSLGTAIAPMLGAILILSDNIKTGEEIQVLDAVDKSEYFAQEASAVSGPFLALAGALVVLAVIFMFIRLPKVLGSDREGDAAKSGFKGFVQALKFPQLRLGALGIFVYVGAEVAIGTYAVSYFVDMNLMEAVMQNDFCRSIVTSFHGDEISNIDPKGIMGLFVAYYWTGAMIGRFLGAGLTYVMKPSVVLTIFATGVLACLGISAGTTGLTSMWSLLAIGLFNSIMFPTIFTLAIDGLGALKAQGSGVLCSAIAGGAAIPPLFGLVTDWSDSFKVAMIVLVVCYAYIGFYGYWFKRRKASEALSAG